jgi:hypothetical protein
MGSAGELIQIVVRIRDVVCDANDGVHLAKVITYEKASGWIQWTWKTEGADEWSYSAGLQYGWIPSDPTQHIYPNICG